MTARYYTGIDGALLIGGTQVAKIRNWSINGEAETMETTNMGASAKTYAFGRLSYSGSCIALYYVNDSGALAMANMVGNTIRTTALPATTTHTMQLRLTSSRVITASVLINSSAITASSGDLVTVALNFVVTGLLTEATMGAA